MQNNNDPFNNLGFLAGLAMMRGVPADEAYLNTAMNQQKLYQAQNQNAEYERMAYARQMLPQIAQKLYGSSPQEAFQELTNIGMDPKEALSILDLIQKQTTPETFKGPNGIQYSKSINPETGEWEAKPLSGQLENDGLQMPTSSEIRTNNNEITKLRQNARGAAKELRLLDDSAKAFENFDKNTGSYIGSGTLVSKLAPKAADNIFYNENAQTAKQEIAKLNSQLFQNRVSALGSAATDTAKQEILKGLPNTELTREARQDLINTKKRENFEQILRSKFFDEWYQKNNKNLTGAEDAFNTFLNGQNLIDDKGNTNKNLLTQIPKAIKEFSSIENNFDNDLSKLADSVSVEEIMAALQGK